MGIPKSMIDKFPSHIQKQINRQLVSKTRMEEIAEEENIEKKSKYSSAKAKDKNTCLRKYRGVKKRPLLRA